MKRTLLYFLPVLLVAHFSFFSEISAQLNTLQTKDLRLFYYGQQQSYLIPHIGRCFENSLNFHKHLFNYTPSEEVSVYLHDLNDYGTGGTNTIPWNYLSIGIEPYDYAYETSPTNERMNWVMNHELTHVVDLDKAAGSDIFFRSLFFGKVSPTSDNPVSMFYSYLTSPRYYSPRWYHEGIAVFLETWMAGGIGRTLGGYDEMVFRTMVRDSAYFYDYIGLESEGKTIDFQIGANSYLYGTRFVSYLASLYGPEKILQWVNRSDGTDRYFASQFERLYGTSLDEEWTRWIAREHLWQKLNIDSIRQYSLTPERRIVPKGLGSVSRAFFDSALGKIYVAVNYPGRIAHAASIDLHDGSMETLCDITTPALYYVSSLAYDDSSHVVFYTTHNGSLWRDINVVDTRSGSTKTLLKNSRVGDLAFNRADKSLWGVRHHNGFSTLVRIPSPYSSLYEILPLQYGKDMFDLDISPDGKFLISSFVEISGRQQLILMSVDSLLKGSVRYEVLHEFENNSPENFVFSQDGKFLYGTSYYTGVSNVFRYSFESKKMEAISNCETGYFHPLPLSADSLLVFRYAGSGFLPVVVPINIREDISAIKYLGQEIVDKFPVVKDWKVGSPVNVNIDSLTIYSGPYNGFEHLQLASIYPVVQGYKDLAAYGLCFTIADPLGLHALDVTASYSPYQSLIENERVHATLNYHYWQWKVNAYYNQADFYDLFGPTKTSRKGYSLSVGYNDFFFNNRPQTFEYTVTVGGYGGLERLPDFQNISTSFDKFFTFNGKISYKYVLRSLGAIDVEKGIRWDFGVSNTLVNAKLFPKISTNIHYGIMLPMDHSSLWLRTSLGFSPGDRNDPFANFYFGGFGNNRVDYQEVQRYREYYSFPGVELNEIGGTTYGKMLLEWSLPPFRFRRFGFQNLYCTYAHLSLFSSGIITNVDDEVTRRNAGNVGAQIDFKIVIFSNLESTLSFGYAAAFEALQRTSKEFMVSLRIL